MNFWQYYFFPVHEVWYRGQIWSNIFASILCGLVVLFATRVILKLLRKQHKEHMDQQDRHHRELKQALNIQDEA